jgi:hypothetical protein
MFQLQSSFRHIMTLAPFFNSSDIVIDLKTSFPRQEVPPHEKVVESGNTNQMQEFGHRLCDYGIF